MTQNWNPGPSDPFHHCDHLLSTLYLHRLHPPFLDETPGIPHCLLYRDLKTHEWHVPDEQCVLRASTHSFAHWQQLVHRHRNRGVVAQYDHTVRIAYENRIHNPISDRRSWEVVRGNHHDALFLSLPLEKVADCELPLLSPMNFSQAFALRPSR